MIKRIVKLSFEEDKVVEFLKIFDSTKDKIRASEGCLKLELLKLINTKGEFYTCSYWEDESYLELYRQSDLFKVTWSKTKLLFKNKAEAYSLSSIEKLD